MEVVMKREEALALLNQHVTNENMIKHCLASEAVMRALARELSEDEEKWGIAGLLHDLDVEITNADLSVHTLETEKILRQHGIDEDIIEAIRLHNLDAHPGAQRTDPFHIALASGETITGLIIATTLVYPDKKLASVKPKSVVKRMKEKAFARSVNRDTILECEKLGMDINQFVEISLHAMKSISGELEL